MITNMVRNAHPLHFFMSKWKGELAEEVKSYLAMELANEYKEYRIIGN